MDPHSIEASAYESRCFNRIRSASHHTMARSSDPSAHRSRARGEAITVESSLHGRRMAALSVRRGWMAGRAGGTQPT